MMNDIIVYLGVALMIITVIVSGYSLLFKKIDTKRLVAFATIGFFSGAILLLSERITNIRLPILGEIVTKAHEDALEINQVLKSVEEQSQIVSGVVEKAKDLQVEMEQLAMDMLSQKRNARIQYVQERINELQDEVAEREQKEWWNNVTGRDRGLNSLEKSQIRMNIERLKNLIDEYSEELSSLKKDENLPANTKIIDK